MCNMETHLFITSNQNYDAKMCSLDLGLEYAFFYWEESVCIHLKM